MRTLLTPSPRPPVSSHTHPPTPPPPHPPLQHNSPSKDDWWTTESQPGNPYGDKPTEPNWQLQAIVIALSTGPNGPSDGIGFTNASLVMSTVRADGVNLQPDRPATTMDAALAHVFVDGSVPDVRSTWTAYLGHAYRWHHILATQLSADFTLALEDLGPIGAAPSFAVRVLPPFFPVFFFPLTHSLPSTPTHARATYPPTRPPTRPACAGV